MARYEDSAGNCPVRVAKYGGEVWGTYGQVWGGKNTAVAEFARIQSGALCLNSGEFSYDVTERAGWKTSPTKGVCRSA